MINAGQLFNVRTEPLKIGNVAITSSNCDTKRYL